MKAFVIRLKDIEPSESLAKECISSSANLGLTVEPFDGVYGEEKIEHYHNIFGIRPWKTKMKKNRLGVKGCFLSHYSLWFHCWHVLKEPIIIFEHDAVLLRPIPEDINSKFKEFLMLDPYNKMKGGYQTQHQDTTKNGVEEYFNDASTSKYGVMTQYVMGLQAYIIKPSAALKLIQNVRQFGYLPADIQCNKELLNIQTIYPSIASVNPRFYGNKTLMKQESTTQKKW